jgi:DNA-binding MarR family transcriptional regulator
MVHAMNNEKKIGNGGIPPYQLQQFQGITTKIFQCCQERFQFQSEKFNLPDAELRCLMLFENERYLTSKGIAHRMKVVKSRVTKIIEGLAKKKLIQRLKDPGDSRITLLSLTAEGQQKINDIKVFQNSLCYEVLVQMAPEQRITMLSNLEMLKASMESAKQLMCEPDRITETE